MINWQSILSSFDDKPTLLEWLKKVQKALNESALTTVTVTQEKAGRVNSITLTFNFQDGTKIVAPAFTVQDGKDGEGITNLVNNNLTNRIHNVTYDTTDGLRVYSEQLSEYTNIEHINRLEFRLPIMAGSGINIAKRKNTNEIEIKVDEGGFKSIFGYESVVGNGSIDLYQHVIKITGSNAPYNDCFAYLTIVSSKKLSVESLTDLKTLLGNTFEYPATGYDLYNIANVYKVTQDGIIGTNGQGQNVTLSFTNMTVFIDTVTTV